jgi:hypothetical protein
MAKPRFDEHYIKVCMDEAPIDQDHYEFNINGKPIVIRGKTIKYHLYKLEHFEETKVAEAFFWLRWHGRPLGDYCMQLAESLATNGSIVPAIHNIPLEFKK